MSQKGEHQPGFRLFCVAGGGGEDRDDPGVHLREEFLQQRLGSYLSGGERGQGSGLLGLRLRFTGCPCGFFF